MCHYDLTFDFRTSMFMDTNKRCKYLVYHSSTYVSEYTSMKDLHYDLNYLMLFAAYELQLELELQVKERGRGEEEKQGVLNRERRIVSNLY